MDLTMMNQLHNKNARFGRLKKYNEPDRACQQTHSRYNSNLSKGKNG
jgi:hypothetical protein